VSSATGTREEAMPRALPQPLTSICLGLLGIGVVAFVWGLLADPQAAWLSYHSNFVFYATLSQAALVLSCIFVIVGARWPGPVKRIAEALGAWVPVTVVLTIIGYFGGDYLFEWKREGAVHGKEAWLNAPRFYITQIGIAAVLAALSVAYLRASLRPTLRRVAESGEGFARRMAESWTSGWRGDEEERRIADERTRFFAPIICMVFALGYTLFALDQVMAMEQTWFSNLFGVYVSWGGILSAVAATTVACVLLRNAPGVGEHVTRPRLHDLGKMIFAFSIFWMYLFYSQYLVIWYGNLPEETQFFYDRLGAQFLIDKGFSELQWDLAWSTWNFEWERLNQAYGWTSMATWACCWIVPFWVLLGARPKRTPAIVGSVAAIVLVGFWLERNLLVWPSVVKEQGAGFSWLGPIQLGIAAGFLGAFLLVFLLYSRVFPGLAMPAETPKES